MIPSMFSNLFTGTPSSTSSSQKNTNEEPPDLGQSRYDFKYLVFPNDLGIHRKPGKKIQNPLQFPLTPHLVEEMGQPSWQ